MMTMLLVVVAASGGQGQEPGEVENKNRCGDIKMKAMVKKRGLHNTTHTGRGRELGVSDCLYCFYF